ncbi:MAG: cupin domain-containing protein [Hyphomicrobiales bacterium]|nr:cupin domain-containing protein [Hyphomicrobiales bacterium]MCP5371649.1 cupin domain-containing protein [Hyphomicrobiales bacterium]
MADTPLIAHLDDLDTYSPPGHSGTTNRRLVAADLGGSFEMVHGTLAPGGTADRHHHEHEFQAMFVLAGRARVTLGSDAPVDCGPGHVVRIPPGLDHEVVSLGPEALQLAIVYSPPITRGK